ncbi:Histone acetyltransferase HPA2/related acetyltransferase [Hahella chejuensis KCTC 2396]|uniref:Histone acetyltransferase HPA2/related acetyltransferase n=1 Tax=Hahella chejuensis (strain KCTC 2396) TaxID=349521 RepID=Q2SGF4_HAHCH|nr:GNAT family N-acetyltransferase [Hahella chejuensis]ABC30270.1 Histone acetyltransferase HPA2/related acetyltransferase [Hahella chejuensis KCTC 2396]
MDVVVKNLKIRRMRDEDKPAVLALQVHEEQVPYVGRTREILQAVRPDHHCHVLTLSNEIVGFFIIDVAYHQSFEFTLDHELGLRAFLIDAGRQGQGIGKSAARALKPYLEAAYSDRPSIALTVNCRNPAAYHCYIGGGFIDTGAQYLGGKAGPQYILRMPVGESL